MVDLGGYIIILMNDNGKIKLYGSSADNADNPEVGDEILEVNGRTLENATDAEVSAHIHQCIKSGTISLQVTRRTGNKMKELDGPNADRIRDAWVIALERGARERLQRLPALRKIQPRDIQAILHQQITEGSASTSTGETPKKDVTNSHITVTLADREAANRNVPAKLSNGTVPKGVAKPADDDAKDRKDALEKQRSCPEESNLLQPVPGGRAGERRASSPFQNGRTEVLIGETEGGPRSPRGSTSSATNDTNLLIPPGDSDYPESIYKSRRRRGSGVADIHLQQSQLQENNNGGSRDIVKGDGESRESRVELSGVPDEMWAQGPSPGHHRELPVDVPDTLLEQAYANKQVMSLMLSRSETTSSSTSAARRRRSTDRHDETNFNIRSASDHENTPDNRHQNRHHGNMLALSVNKTTANNTNNVAANKIGSVIDAVDSSAGFLDNNRPDRTASPSTIVAAKSAIIGAADDNQNHSLLDESATLARIIELNALNASESRDLSSPLPKKPDDVDEDDATSNEEDVKLVVARGQTEKTNPFEMTDDEEEDIDDDDDMLPISSASPDVAATSPTAFPLQKESSVDADEDYPFAKEDYPTMLKTCSDDSASPRSSSGRSDSTAPLDGSLVIAGKESPLYDARRIDLGSPCRPLVPEIKIAPIFARNRETTSFDNPAYGLAADLHELRQGLLMRSDEVTDLTRLIDEQQSLANGRKPRTSEKTTTSSTTATSPIWTSKDQPIHQVHQTRIGADTKTRKKSKSRSNRDDLEIDGEGLLGAGSTDDLLNGELTNLTITRSVKKKKQQQQQQQQQQPETQQQQQQHSSSGYSTLRSDASIADFPDQQIRSDRSFLVVGNRAYREVAVDCPADFVPIAKTHPVYPPPNRGDSTIDRRSTTLLRSLKNEAGEKNRDAKIGNVADVGGGASTLGRRARDVDAPIDADVDNDHPLSRGVRSDDFVSALGGRQDERTDKAGVNGVKPAIPPRDQKRAPARPPKDNVRLSTRNNNIEQTDNANTPEPTQQQLHSIRKYQEQLRRRKEEDERQEVLNGSLRCSSQLKALESHATSLYGQENPAYAQDEVTSTVVARPAHGTPGQTTPREAEEPPKVLTYGEVVATLERLQLQLRNLSGALGVSGPGVEAELEAVRTLLVQRRFATALATHQALKTRLRTGKVLKHHDDDASNLARDCVEVLEEWQSTSVGTGETRAMVEELTGLLTSYEMEGLLLAHDSIISYVDGIQRKASPSSSSPSRSPSPSSSLRGSRNTDNIKIIRIEKTNEPLGATVRNEGDAVIIGRVVRGGAADKSGLFHEGDEVLEVNGVEMRGKSVNDVCDILAGMQGGLTFLVLPASTNQRNNVANTRREDSAQIQHVRAHFDYDPEEDPYIPCRELGVSFQKGDVLHVISQEDSNWWQAYREGEEDHTLAGLIPSRAFQHQRESVKQTFAGGKSTMRGSKKSSTLLCTRKNPKKKKKRGKCGSNFNDEGYPLYATTTIDDYDSEEVLTYEEVALYYPRANHKRPIVLIGPPNIGRHELRQRLMQDSERFAAAIPHTSRPRKGSEVDGQDYHFISRSQFESDILCRKFVEHGEYEKAYYGTSVEAIRSVVNSGKICVLNLHPQSLKILRSSDLKPYVVFVAPPSLEKLRQKRIKNNESFKEEELKDIIEKAREMEDKYGHLFDMIILNNDTDRAYNQLLTEINSLEREPQWVPASWVQ